MLKEVYAQVQGVAALLRPWFAGPPAPLTDTVPPQSLGDPDSRWVCVDGVDLHYKEVCHLWRLYWTITRTELQ